MLGVSSRSAHASLGPEATLPLVNCVCPTYNRPPHYQRLLEEAIASFLRQDHPNKELIALDGCLGQEADLRRTQNAAVPGYPQRVAVEDEPSRLAGNPQG